MAKPIVLCADSTCDLTPELIEKYQVKILPLHVTVEEETYSDGGDITPDDIYAIYKEKKILPKTAAINMDEVLEFATPYIEAGNDVLCVTLGSGLSTTFNSFRLAAMEQEGIYVIDSNSLSTGNGHMVIAAAERIELVKNAIAKYKHFDEVHVSRAGCTISSHCGPNTLGIIFVRK